MDEVMELMDVMILGEYGPLMKRLKMLNNL